MIFTVSARGKSASIPIVDFLSQNFAYVSFAQIDSVFGFVERCTLYGGRPFEQPQLSDNDVQKMNALGIGLRLPLTNHYVEQEEYENYRWLLEKYHTPGNSVIITNDTLARWIRRDYPLYQVEASVIKDIDSYTKIAKALELYDTVVLPMRFNEDLPFLDNIEPKQRITLFANAGCALTCPAKICYPAISKRNKFTHEQSEFVCSQPLKSRVMRGMVDFDLKKLTELGFHRFKLLRQRPGGITGY